MIAADPQSLVLLQQDSAVFPPLPLADSAEKASAGGQPAQGNSATERPLRASTPFAAMLGPDHRPLRRASVKTLQVNLGKLCNQACKHCHVEAGPTKTRENMDRPTVDRILDLISRDAGVRTVDITGGAPELNPHFRHFVASLRRAGRHVIDRCNLTVLAERGQESTADFLADQRVEIIASLPCYSAENVDRQRGRGVFERSIDALRRLNSIGYGHPGTELTLRLVFNPAGPTLPPPQADLQRAYKQQLWDSFGIVFNELLTITNLPIKRFRWDLERSGRIGCYMQLLQDQFNPEVVDAVMCRSLVSIGWDGRIYDCDFNQMLDMPAGGQSPTVWNIEAFHSFIGAPISVADHCYGCTAGAGSSCTGTLT